VRVTVRYLGPLASEVGLPAEVVTFSSAVRLRDVLQAVTASKGRGFRRLILDGRGEMQPFLLVALNGQAVRAGQDPVVGDGAEVTLLIGVSGG